MFDHVTIRVSDHSASERFYALVLQTLAIEQSHSGEHFAEWNDFSLAHASDDRPATRRLHVGFAAPSREHADESWRAGTSAGFRDDGAPGLRPEYSETYYGAFLLDPDGNSAEAVHRDGLRQGGVVDHVWIRVADAAASQRFYSTIAPYAGYELRPGRPDRARFAGESGSFSVLAGTPTEHLHIAFGAADDATVDAFHDAAVEAGYRDNGGPGERPIYHRGYYSAFVLDPDGNNVEVVNHNRR